MRYIIGDIQGCFSEFKSLLNKINFNRSKDTLYLVGDLVNRGPNSLETLQWIYDNSDCVISVLGNHDIFLLARYYNLVDIEKDDTIDEILTSSNVNKLIDYVRTLPLIYEDKDFILSHAGIYPKLKLNKILALNEKFGRLLNSSYSQTLIEKIYGNKPAEYDDDMNEFKKLRFLVNSCTRMRYLNKSDNSLDFKCKTKALDGDDSLVPWYKVAREDTINKKIIFGHWASLGVMQYKNYLSLDSGCVWGGQLTAYNYDKGEFIQVNASK